MRRPLWVDPEDQRYPRLDRDIEVDVAIIGGGLAGIGAAYVLPDRCRVALLEARTLASGATGRNAGFVIAGPAMAFDAAVHAVGREEVEAVWHFSVENNRFIARAIEEHDIRCGYLRRGSMALAASEDEWEELRATARSLAESAIECCIVERTDLPVPFDRSHSGGIFSPGNAEMNSAAFARGLARTLAPAVNIFEHSPVRALSRRGGWVVSAAGGTVRATALILATNAYSQRLLPELAIEPKRGQVVATDPLGEVVVPFPMHANHGYLYWRQTVEGRLVVGGGRDMDLPGEVGTEELLHAEIQQELERLAGRIAGKPLPVAFRWAGIMGFTPDHFPMVGSLPGREGLYIAAGFSGHGVSLALRSGMEVARMAFGEEVDLPTAFNPARFGRPTGASYVDMV